MRNSLVVFSLVHFVLFVFHVLYTHKTKHNTEIITQPSRLTHKVVVGHDGEKDILLNDHLAKTLVRLQSVENKVKLVDNYDKIVKDCRTYNRVIKGTKKLLKVSFDHVGNHCTFAMLKGDPKKVNYKEVKEFLDNVNVKRLGK